MKKKGLSPRERLLQAGIRVFAEKGYIAASVDEIVALAGLAKPALYYYFKNKEGLYHAVLAYGFDERLSLAQEALEKNGGWRERLTAFVRSVLMFSGEQNALFRITLQASLAPQGERPPHLPLQKMGRQNMDYFCAFFRRGIKEGFFKKEFDARALTAAFHGQLLFYVLLHNLDPAALPARLRAEDIVEIFLSGVSAPVASRKVLVHEKA
ncbi:MAG: TetR/AcrR family transcriptional regulator [bacterium]